MIHYTKEGTYLKTGLNITLGHVGWWPWITFVWCWYHVQSRTLTHKRLRIRTHKWPMVITASSEVDIINHYLRTEDLIAVPRELLEDHAPKIVVLARYFNEQFGTGVISRYNG